MRWRSTFRALQVLARMPHAARSAHLHEACKAERWWMVEAVQHAQMPTSHWPVAGRVEKMDTHPPAGSGRFQLHLLTRLSGEICSRWALRQLRVLDRLEKVSSRAFGALLIGSRDPAGRGAWVAAGSPAAPSRIFTGEHVSWLLGRLLSNLGPNLPPLRSRTLARGQQHGYVFSILLEVPPVAILRRLC